MSVGKFVRHNRRRLVTRAGAVGDGQSNRLGQAPGWHPVSTTTTSGWKCRVRGTSVWTPGLPVRGMFLTLGEGETGVNREVKTEGGKGYGWDGVW